MDNALFIDPQFHYGICYHSLQEKDGAEQRSSFLNDESDISHTVYLSYLQKCIEQTN